MQVVAKLFINNGLSFLNNQKSRIICGIKGTFDKNMRELLLPISSLYAAVLVIRHSMYDMGIMRSNGTDVPSICIGNLELGGTGKTPLTEYVARLLMGKMNVAIVSGGYKRKSKETVIADANATIDELGDEAMQHHCRLGNKIMIAVAKNRMAAVSKLYEQSPTPDVIIFDDAFQHRKVKAGLNIIVTNFSNPFYNNHLIPSGTLRDIKCRAKSADIFVVGKTPDDATESDKGQIRAKLAQYGNQSVYFSSLAYGQAIACNKAAQKTLLDNETDIIGVCGIAQPDYFIKHLEGNYNVSEKMAFNDHHAFTENDINRMVADSKKNKIVVTTEKDAMRLTKNPYFSKLKDTPVFYIPVGVRLNSDEAPLLSKEILNYVAENKQGNGLHKRKD